MKVYSLKFENCSQCPDVINQAPAYRCPHSKYETYTPIKDGVMPDCPLPESPIIPNATDALECIDCGKPIKRGWCDSCFSKNM